MYGLQAAFEEEHGDAWLEEWFNARPFVETVESD